ncbi:MAG: helix-turn-helix domain-containing protein [Bryobacteraceae bacterium]
MGFGRLKVPCSPNFDTPPAPDTAYRQGRGLFVHKYHANGHAAWTVDVRGIRKRLRLSQERFADRFGLSVDAVRHWESGRRQPEAAARRFLPSLPPTHNLRCAHWLRVREFVTRGPLLYGFWVSKLWPGAPALKAGVSRCTEGHAA